MGGGSRARGPECEIHKAKAKGESRKGRYPLTLFLSRGRPGDSNGAPPTPRARPSSRVRLSRRASTCPAPFLNPLDALSSAVRSRGAGAGGPKHEMLTRPSFPGPIYEHDGTHHRRATTSPAALLLAVGAARPGPPTPTAGRRPTAPATTGVRKTACGAHIAPLLSSCPEHLPSLRPCSDVAHDAGTRSA